MHHRKALLIGNTDGIGLALTHLLLARWFHVIGLSRRDSTVVHPMYSHIVQDVSEDAFRGVLEGVVSTHSDIDVCVYCAGVGAVLDLKNIAAETKVFQVNLMSAVIATEVAIKNMLTRGAGHFIGLSSVMDMVISSEVPSYTASKAGISSYWEGLGLALAGSNVKVSNIRFGFVDTKMADAPVKPFLMSAQQAAEFIFEIIKKPRIRATKPIIMGFLMWLYSLPIRLKLLFQ